MGEELQLWVEAWHGLRENPLAVYLSQAEARRQRRLGWWRRNLAYLLLLALSLLVATLAGIDIYSTWSRQGGDLLRDPEVVLLPLAIVILPLYILWACAGLYQALLDALLVLAPPSRRTHSLTIDDLSAITLLTDREFIAGALKVLLPPLLWRLAGGVGLVWVGLALSTLGTRYLDWGLMPFGSGNELSLWTALALSPLTLGALLLSGTLALTILLLFMLALGRQLQTTLASASAVIMVLAQLLYAQLALGLLLMTVEPFPVEFPAGARLATQIIMALLLAWLIAAALRGAETSRAWRYVLAAGTPLLAIFLPLLIFLPIGFWTDWDNAIIDKMMYPMYCYGVQLGAVSVLNPLALPGPWCWGDLEATRDTLWPEWLRYLFVTGLQLALLAICANYALRSVRLRRQAD